MLYRAQQRHRCAQNSQPNPLAFSFRPPADSLSGTLYARGLLLRGGHLSLLGRAIGLRPPRAGFFFSAREGIEHPEGLEMAGRPMNKLHQEDVRKKIQASQLINVLQNHALGDSGEISPSRMKAIEILLRKSVADLSAISLTGDGGGPVQFQQIKRVIVDQSGTGT